MPRLTYVGPHDAVAVLLDPLNPMSVEVVVEQGGSFDFPAALAKSLLEQPSNWQPAKKPEKGKE